MINWDSAFGKNDIRGIYGKDVTEELFFFTSKAYIKYRYPFDFFRGSTDNNIAKDLNNMKKSR